MSRRNHFLHLSIKLISIIAFTLIACGSAIAANHIAVVEDYSGILVDLHPSNGIPPMQNATNAFYSMDGVEDEFDFIFVFLTGASTLFTPTDTMPRAYTTAQAGNGTGAPAADATPQSFGSDGQLKLVGDMYIVSALPSNPEDDYFPLGNAITGSGAPSAVFSGVEMVGRMAGSYWMAYAKYGSNQGDMLDNPSNPSFWSFFFHTGSSVMGGNFFRDDGSDRWMIMDQEKKYSTLDQYFMGMIGPDEVMDENTEYFFVNPTNNDYARTDLPALGGGFMKGTKGDNITMEQITSAMGPITPDHTQSQKNFRCAFVLVAPPGQVNGMDVNKLDMLRNKFEIWFNHNTSINGYMDCTLDGSGVDGDEDGGGSDGDEDMCVPDSKRCKGDIVEQCDTNHDWLPIKNCSDDDMTCNSGECVSSGCQETEGGSSSCQGTCCDPSFVICLGNSLCTCKFDSDTGEGVYTSNNCVNLCENNGKEFDFCGAPEEGLDAACVCEGGVVSPDGEGEGEGEGEAEDECTPQSVALDCLVNQRCLGGNCVDCPEGEVRTGNENFCVAGEDDDDSGSGGCSATAGASAWLMLLAAAAIRRKRR